VDVHGPQRLRISESVRQVRRDRGEAATNQRRTVTIGHDAQQIRLYACENHLGDRGRIQDRT
jgi:hypothetical protein